MTNRLFGAAAAVVLASTAAATSPVTLSYRLVPVDGGAFRYVFTLTLDNHDGSWIEGQGFGWVVFGDGCGAPSPLWDFVGDGSSIASGPWTGFDATAGFNSGPSLGPLRSLWYPAQVGDSISWSGTSSVELPSGWLRWSFLVTDGRDGPIECETGRFVSRCGLADVNEDGFLDGQDFDLFVVLYDLGSPSADLDLSGFVNSQDWSEFLLAYTEGC